MDIVSYLLSRKYTDNSIRGISGVLAGKNCTIESATKQDGLTTIVFKWTADDGVIRRTTIQVEDGTPIYVWTSGNHYEYGDLVIYASAFYRCITDNSDIEFDDTKWNEIGSPDGNYDIVQSTDLLPVRFTAADRKMYYVIEDNCFYLWNGVAWVKTICNSINELDDVNLTNIADGEILVWDATAEKWVNGHKATLLDTMGRYNVLDYGLIGDGTTDNTTALRNMISSVPWGSIIYFPKGVYNISDGFTINKSVFFEGETTTQQRFLTATSQPSTSWQDSAINYVGNNTDITLFNIVDSVGCTFRGITFYGHAYATSENTDAFSTLPYPFFKETELISNINCLARNGGSWSVEDCMFLGFSGYAVQIKQNVYVKNCGFFECKVGILEEGTDSSIQNCYFTRCGTAIVTADYDAQQHYSNINISDCWADQLAHHFIRGNNTGSVMYNISNTWVDMVDESAISAPNAQLHDSVIQGRFSRCGMKYAGLQDADFVSSMADEAFVIYVKKITKCQFNIMCQKREIGSGNNSHGVCPYKLFYVVDSGNLTESDIITDMASTDIINSSAYQAKVHLLSGEDFRRYSIWNYDYANIHFRNNSPIGVLKSNIVNALCYDTSHHILYRATAVNDNTAWEIVATLYTAGNGIDITNSVISLDATTQDILNNLGTASTKNATDRVEPNNTNLVESQSVYSAINSALSSIYTPRGDISCAELTSDLLIVANVGNVYELSDSGTTTALFLQGAGLPLTAGDNVGIINAGEGRILFNLMANAFDLTDYQKKDLTTPITVGGVSQTTVEGALSALSTVMVEFTQADLEAMW